MATPSIVGAVGVADLLADGYKVRTVTVRLVRKLEAFKTRDVALVKFKYTQNGVKMYFLATAKKTESEYPTKSDKPVRLKLVLKRKKGGENA